MIDKNRQKTALLYPLNGANCLYDPVKNLKQGIFTHQKCLQSNKYAL